MPFYGACGARASMQEPSGLPVVVLMDTTHSATAPLVTSAITATLLLEDEMICIVSVPEPTETEPIWLHLPTGRPVCETTAH